MQALPPRPPGFLPLFGILAILPGIWHLRYSGLDPDMFWHLRVADQLLQVGIGPLVDTFSFNSKTTPWIPYSWLAELIMRQIWLWGGYHAAVLTQVVLLAAILGFVTAAALQAPRISWLGAMAATAMVFEFIAGWLYFRPVTFGILVLSVILWLQQRDVRLGERSRAVWLIPLLAAVGINLHPFSALAAIWLAIPYANTFFENRAGCEIELRTRRRRRLGLLLLTGAACCATPMLPGMIETILFYNSQDPMVSCSNCIRELEPMYEKGWMGATAIGIIVALFVLMLNQVGRLTFIEWMALVVVAAMTIGRGRYAPLMALTLLPVLSRSIMGADDARLHEPRLVRALYGLCAALCGALIWLFPSADKTMQQWMERNRETAGFPVAAVSYVESNIHPHWGRVINGFTWGGYIGWHLGDRFKVFMDGRTQVHPPEFWQVAMLGSMRQLTDYLKGVRADAAILSPDSDFDRVLRGAGWREAYKDAKSVVLVPPCASLENTENDCGQGLEARPVSRR